MIVPYHKKAGEVEPLDFFRGSTSRAIETEVLMDRQKALDFLKKHLQQENIIKHLLATEAVMGALFDRIKEGEREDWIMAGLLHDGDYVAAVPHELQGIKVSEMLEAEGFTVPESVRYAMAAHNADNTGIQPQSKMDWALFCADSLTGLIVATALVRPDKKLASVEVGSVMKKFKNPSFAAGTRREDIAFCQEKLDIPLDEFVSIALTAMQKIAVDLGL